VSHNLPLCFPTRRRRKKTRSTKSELTRTRTRTAAQTLPKIACFLICIPPSSQNKYFPHKHLPDGTIAAVSHSATEYVRAEHSSMHEPFPNPIARTHCLSRASSINPQVRSLAHAMNSQAHSHGLPQVRYFAHAMDSHIGWPTIPPMNVEMALSMMTPR
jgi:hypothetical protein